MADQSRRKKWLIHEYFSNKEIILASNSPRRQQFLKDSGVNFTVQTHAVEEVLYIAS